MEYTISKKDCTGDVIMSVEADSPEDAMRIACARPDFRALYTDARRPIGATRETGVSGKSGIFSVRKRDRKTQSSVLLGTVHVG